MSKMNKYWGFALVGAAAAAAAGAVAAMALKRRPADSIGFDDDFEDDFDSDEDSEEKSPENTSEDFASWEEAEDAVER